jgi:hypothetical protein
VLVEDQDEDELEDGRRGRRMMMNPTLEPSSFHGWAGIELVKANNISI